MYALITAMPYISLYGGLVTKLQADLTQSNCFLDFLFGIHTPVLSVSLPEMTNMSTEPKRHFLEGHQCPSLLIGPLY